MDNKSLDPFNNVTNKELLPMVADPLLAQKYAEGNIQDPSNYFSSKAFIKVVVGTKRGNGVDFIDIQKAIDTVNQAGGGVIFFRAGTYIIDRNITLYSKIKLLGEDYATTIFDFNDTGYAFVAHGNSITPLTNIVIENLQFTNQLPTIFPALAVLDYDFVQDSKISYCYFHNITEPGNASETITIGNSKRVTIQNCLFGKGGETSDNQVIIESTCSFILIKDNYIAGIATSGNLVVKGTHCVVANNLGEAPQQTMITIGSFDTAGSFGVVVGNIIKDAATKAIRVQGGHNSVCSNVIDATSSNAIGIQVNGGDNCIISDNTIEGYSSAGGIGIQVTSNADENVVANNRISNCNTGIEINASTENNNLVHGNMLRGNTTAFTDNGTATTSADNVT